MYRIAIYIEYDKIRYDILKISYRYFLKNIDTNRYIVLYRQSSFSYLGCSLQLIVLIVRDARENVRFSWECYTSDLCETIKISTH
jgi:hypothetical protein